MAKRKSMLNTINQNTSHASEAMFGSPESLSRLSSPNADRTLSETDHLDMAMIDIDSLQDNTENTFKVENLTMLIESIKARGLLQPLVVQPLTDENGNTTGRYEIRSGSRRFASISQIVREAQKRGDRKTEETFREVPCYMLPKGATDEEIAAVVVETNTTARQITVADIFRNFDIIFAKEEDGSYRYIPKGGNMTLSVMKMLGEMGLEFRKSAVNEYIKIYSAQNPKIKDCLEKGLISKKDALLIAGMSAADQGLFMQYRDDFDDAHFRQKIAEYRADKKKAKDTVYIKGAEAISQLDRLQKTINRLGRKTGYLFSDQMQKTRAKSQLNEIKKAIDEIEKNIDKS